MVRRMNLELEKQYFKKRPGTTDVGKDYEVIFIANLIPELMHDDEVSNFKISSNEDDFGALDDVILQITLKDDSIKNYAFQLKHIDNQTLTLKHLNKKSGNFSIIKYFKDSPKLLEKFYDLILLTNCKFNYKEKEARFRLDGDNFDVKVVPSKTHFLKFFTENVYQFETIPEKDENNEFVDVYKDFFSKFYLCTNYPDINELKKSTKEKFCNLFSCHADTFRNFYDFLIEWSLKKKALKLNKKFMQLVIAFHLLSPFLKTVSPVDVLTEEEKVRFELLQIYMSKFQVTYFTLEDLDNLKLMLGYVVHKFRDSSLLRDANIVGLKYQLIQTNVQSLQDLPLKICNLLLWIIDYGPLVVVESDTIYQALSLCENKKLLVLQKNLQNSNGFKCLSDLSQEDLDIVGNTFQCMFQGKGDLALRDLIGPSKKLSKIITTSHLLQSVKKELIIGGKEESLPKPYVVRRLTRFVIEKSFLDLNTKSAIIVTGADQSLFSGAKFTKMKDWMIDDYEFRASVVYLFENCSKEMFTKISSSTEASCHQFRYVDNALEWIRSKGELTELKPYLHETFFVSEIDVLKYEEDNSVNIVCGDAGMGKTTLFKALKNMYSKHFWTFLIYPKDHTKYFRENGANLPEFLEYIVNYTVKGCIFEKQLLEIFLEEGRFNILWDALDETPDETLKAILSLVEQLKSKGCKQWLSARSHFQGMLEKRFNCLSRNLRELDEEEQRQYIGQKLNAENLDEVFEKIHRNVQLFKYNKVLGIPLQIYMFTELLKNFNKYKSLLNKILSLAELYECFVAEKFTVLHEEKEQFDGNNGMVYKRNKKFQVDQIKKYEAVGMKLHFPEFAPDCGTFLDELKVENDSVGLITRVSEDGIADFWHPSYGEYFTALYLSQHLEIVTKLSNFFENKCANIRFFFDLIMAKERPAHIATLYKNFEVFKSCSESEIRSKDKIGRNPLQLACAWGEYFPDLHQEQLNPWFFIHAKYRVYAILGADVKRENSEYLKIVDELIEKNDVLNEDDLFGFTCFLYADRGRCLSPLSLLAKTHAIPFDQFVNFNQQASVLYYSCVFDFSSVLEALPSLPIVEDELGESLVHAAAKSGSLKCLKKLNSLTYYRSIIKDDKNKLLNMALDNRRHAVAEFLFEIHKFEVTVLNELLLHVISGKTSELCSVQLLVENGAQINIQTEYGTSPFYLACRFDKLEMATFLIVKGVKVEEDGLLRCCGNNPDITQLLIDNGANVNAANSDGKTPLHHAFEYDHYDTINVLLDHKADVNIGEPQFGCRPIHFASMKGKIALVQRLIECGADLNATNVFGYTPLHYACGQKHRDVVELLVKKGAWVDVEDGKGRSPLDYEVEKGNEELINILKQGEKKPKF